MSHGQQPLGSSGGGLRLSTRGRAVLGVPRSGPAVVGMLVFGAVSLGLGVLAWSGIWRSWIMVPAAGRVVFALIPRGLGAVVLGIALLPVRVLVAPAFLLVAIGAVLMVWQPRWFVPSWYKRAHTTHVRGPSIIRLALQSRETRRGTQQSPLPAGPPALEAPATLLDATRAPVTVAGLAISARSGRLALFENELVFRSDTLDRTISGDDFTLAIALGHVERVEISPRNWWSAMRTHEVGGALAMLKRLHVVASSGDYFFVTRGQKRWLAALESKLRKQSGMTSPAAPEFEAAGKG